MNCNKCGRVCIKNGFQKNGRQRYYCKICELNQQKVYVYQAYKRHINQSIYTLLINSCGVRDISRVLEISKKTVSTRIVKIAQRIRIPIFTEYSQSYEMDELFVKNNGKRCWISYAINRKTKQVISFVVGSKSRENLAKVTNQVLLLNPKKVYTDKLTTYKTLIPKEIHDSCRYQTNRIERFNLNLRTHLKRLNRKTICYSKSLKMLESIIKIYFWGSSINFEFVNNSS